ncbi:MAG: tRNA pseudouridine(55) synthase TruB [Clostridium sp.]|jgi:tRNA pseudouridine55 synthase|nr:tRNA pseudouridine(55) synthase TruB [Clostridium sp.]
MFHGMIAVHKEAGFTSHDVVAKMRGILGQKQVGHTGTLDPDATGVLPICVGKGTKLAGMLSDQDKEYIAELRFGIRTTTQDISGEILESSQIDTLREADVDRVINQYAKRGGYEQIPPMYSALKVGGKHLYELARLGQTVERKARQVVLSKVELLALDLTKNYAKIHVACSKGTYIRTLIADIGEDLGCGAAMATLVRTRVGQICLDECVTLSELEIHKANQTLAKRVIPIEYFFQDLSACTVTQSASKLLENGNALLPTHFLQFEYSPYPSFIPCKRVRVYDTTGMFRAIYQYDADRELYRPEKMF